MAHGHQDQSQVPLVEEACLNAFRTESGDAVQLLPLLSEQLGLISGAPILSEQLVEKLLPLLSEQLVERLLPLLSEPTTITTRMYKYGMSFQLIRQPQHKLENELELVSLVHLAAYWGWESIVSNLVSVYKCDANRKDEMDHIPLHYAASNGHIDVVKYFVEKQVCTPMAKNCFGETPVHFACSNGHLEISRYLIKNKSCSPLCESVRGSTPLHYASQNGHLEIVKYLISEENCKSSCKNCKSETPLHYASHNGHLEIITYLIENTNDSHELWFEKNIDGNTPLHFACSNGHLNVVKYLIEEKNCNPSCENNERWTPLHFACIHLDIVKYLIERECNPSSENRNQYTPLHGTCRRGHLKVARYLIEQELCDPSCKDKDDNTPLLLACVNGELSIVQYLIEEKGCDPCYGDNAWGNTPLHEACINDHPKIVEYLLSIEQVDPLTKNKNGNTALYYASGKFDVVKQFEPFEKCRTAFPVQTCTKLILIGDSGVGKTTIAEVIVRLATRTARVVDVKLHTAGIIPHHIQSEQFGNYVMYDFAGQQEYYSSHDAVLEQVMRKSAAIFVCVIDLSESDEEKMCESLHYWLSFIDNACSTAEGKSHVVIIGSHADQVKSLAEKKSSLLRKIIAKRKEVKCRKYIGYIAMDCRTTNTVESRHLITTLTSSQKTIAASQPIIHYYSHVVYAFLRTKLNVVGCTLHDLFSKIVKENHSSLPKDKSVLKEILTTLSDNGLILFLQQRQSSWIIVKTETLLKEINGTLFAPDHFKEHRDLASNTGVVPVSNFQKLFPNYDSEMVVGFLTSLQFCRPLDQSVLQYTNLQTTLSHTTDNLYFFPGLVLSERPDNLIQQGALKFGYCLRCMVPNEFFSSRFLHVLLLSVAFKYPLLSLVALSSVSGLQRICKVWKSGIFWRTTNDIITVIELIDKNRCVLVAMSCDDTSPIEHAKLRSSVIGLVRHLQQQYSSCLNVCEFLISPNVIQRYPLDNLPDSDLFDIHNVARSMLLHEKGVPSYKDGRGFLTIEALPFEPYYRLSSSSVCQLFNPNLADQPVPSPLLHEVSQLCRQTKMKPQVYKELREHLDNLSLFAGRNPLVSSMQCAVL